MVLRFGVWAHNLTGGLPVWWSPGFTGLWSQSACAELVVEFLDVGLLWILRRDAAPVSLWIAVSLVAWCVVLRAVVASEESCCFTCCRRS